jgi:hypothetical protein
MYIYYANTHTHTYIYIYTHICISPPPPLPSSGDRLSLDKVLLHPWIVGHCGSPSSPHRRPLSPLTHRPLWPTRSEHVSDHEGDAVTDEDSTLLGEFAYYSRLCPALCHPRAVLFFASFHALLSAPPARPPSAPPPRRPAPPLCCSTASFLLLDSSTIRLLDGSLAVARHSSSHSSSQPS